MRRVRVERPSFPEAEPNASLAAERGKEWQVLCGDEGHWRTGLFSPARTRAEQCQTLEKHDCPELFVLLEGQVTLVLGEPGGVRELPLEPGRPVLVTAPHSGFCPGGPHSGVALVVERDAFTTEYQDRPGARS